MCQLAYRWMDFMESSEIPKKKKTTASGIKDIVEVQSCRSYS